MSNFFEPVAGFSYYHCYTYS